jgi:hypothetical protein
VHRDFLIILCSHSYSSSKNLQSQVVQFKHGHRRPWRYSRTRVRVFQNVLSTCTTNFFFVRAYSVLTALTTLFRNVSSICTTDLDIISECVHCVFLRPYNTMYIHRKCSAFLLKTTVFMFTVILPFRRHTLECDCCRQHPDNQ